MREVLSLVCCALVTAGCAETRIERTMTFARPVAVRVSTSTTDQAVLGCVAWCQEGHGMQLGDCLAQCPGHVVGARRCGQPLAGQICGDQMLQWTETVVGRCSQIRANGDASLIRCSEREVEDPDAKHNGPQLALALLGAVVLGAIYIVGSGAR